MRAGYKGSYTYRHQDKNLAAIGGTSTRSTIYLSPLLNKNDYYITDDEDNVTTTYNPPTALVALKTNYENKIATNHSVYVEIEPVKNLKLRQRIPITAISRMRSLTTRALFRPRIREKAATLRELKGTT